MMFEALANKCSDPEMIFKTLLALSGKLDGLALYSDGDTVGNKVLAKTLNKFSNNIQ